MGYRLRWEIYARSVWDVQRPVPPVVASSLSIGLYVMRHNYNDSEDDNEYAVRDNGVSPIA